MRTEGRKDRKTVGKLCNLCSCYQFFCAVISGQGREEIDIHNQPNQWISTHLLSPVANTRQNENELVRANTNASVFSNAEVRNLKWKLSFWTFLADAARFSHLCVHFQCTLKMWNIFWKKKSKQKWLGPLWGSFANYDHFETCRYSLSSILSHSNGFKVSADLWEKKGWKPHCKQNVGSCGGVDWLPLRSPHSSLCLAGTNDSHTAVGTLQEIDECHVRDNVHLRTLHNDVSPVWNPVTKAGWDAENWRGGFIEYSVQTK